MKLLCISHGSTLNGAERSFAEMLKALSSLNYELHAIFPEDGPLLELCKPYLTSFSIVYQPWWNDRGIRLTWKEKIKTLGRILKYSKKNYTIIKNINPDIIISNSSVNPCGAIASKIMNKKHIWYLRELGKEDLGFNLIFGKRFSLWMINRLSSKVFFNSFFLESSYEKYISKKKRFVLYQAVELNTSPPTNILEKKADFLTLVMVGRLAEGKGQLDAVQATNELVKSGEKVNLLLIGVGDDHYSIQVRKYIEENKLSEYVKLIRFTKDINAYYELADLSIVCSKSEAFGRITIESMKMGLPVVSSDTGANVELIQEGLNGYLYKYKDVEDLAQKILLFKDDKKRKECSYYAKEWANERFNMYNYSQRLKELL